nr:MAG TPA: hypothetical protein [Caudoviricetes sp.]
MIITIIIISYLFRMFSKFNNTILITFIECNSIFKVPCNK